MDYFSSLNLLFNLLAQHVNMIRLTCFFSSSNQTHKLFDITTQIKDRGFELFKIR